jgi:hypothetical protein
LFVAAADELEEQIGVAVGIGEVADLVDDQQARRRIVAQTPPQGRVAVEGGKVSPSICPALVNMTVCPLTTA